MTLVAKITLHSQQICGLAWSFDGKLFASGGNDNLCCLTEVEKVFSDHMADSVPQTQDDVSESPVLGWVQGPPRPSGQYATLPTNGVHQNIEDEIAVQMVRISTPSIQHLDLGSEKYRWTHGAAVKAIAFCPWREGLVATGGGSNDKCIHFYHTMSGAALATIAVSAQVTSLIWSKSKREIAATFGYAQPDHPFRIAVFSWPDCRQVAAIP